MLIRPLLGLVLCWSGICEVNSQRVITVDNCTCEDTSDHGIYSLWSIRGTGGKPRFLDIPGIKYPNWRYAYNPCTPFNFGECKDVALCRYPEKDRPGNYHQIGVQKGFHCIENNEGNIEFIYPPNDPNYDFSSKVILVCDASATTPIFMLKDEDNDTFTLKHFCACKNRCSSPVPGPTGGPKSSSTSPTSNPSTSEKSSTKLSTAKTPSSETTSNPSTSEKSSTKLSTAKTPSSETTGTGSPTSTSQKSIQADHFPWIDLVIATVVILFVVAVLVSWKLRLNWFMICCTGGAPDEIVPILTDRKIINIRDNEPRDSNLLNVKKNNDLSSGKKNCNNIPPKKSVVTT